MADVMAWMTFMKNEAINKIVNFQEIHHEKLGRLRNSKTNIKLMRNISETLQDATTCI